jgi:NAD(P) transhydrogenase subunit beta
MDILANVGYLVSISLFAMGLKLLSSPRTARRGNAWSAVGMLIAIIATLIERQIVDFKFIIAGVIIGGFLGFLAAVRVKMTAMPQMVGLLNAFGGGASALVALAQFLDNPGALGTFFQAMIAVTLWIGMITFTGSVLAFAKLEGWTKEGPVVLPAHTVLNALLLLAILVLTGVHTASPSSPGLLLLIVIFVVSSVLGVTLVLPIGGADMPVVIALLNSYSGMAAAASGFVITNYVLIVSGTLVGVSGIILSNIMCKAMNRSLANVLFGAVGGGAATAAAGATARRSVKGYSAQDAAVTMINARTVIIVPGYGLAVAQAQYILHETEEFLRKHGTRVLFAIHPVAGRMPGHMNVLLAEANVSYDLLKDIDEINPEFKNADVVLVVGANDVINPAAREKGNPLSGMPILNADEARSVIIIKRSLKPGFAGVDNPLFYDPKTLMVFDDAREALVEILAALKQSI